MEGIGINLLRCEKSITKKKIGNNAGNLILLLILGNGEMCAEKKMKLEE